MNYKNKILPIIRQTRAISLSKYGVDKIIRQKGQSQVDVVTEVDIKIEKLLKNKLKILYPDIEFVGEELGGNRKSSRFWLVDPIDGTGHYIRGLPFCTTMLALIDKGKPVFSVIYDFVKDEVYWAQSGGGAFCNKTRIGVSNRKPQKSYIACETHLAKPANIKILNSLEKKMAIMSTISSGWEHAMVATGKLDARICFDPYGCDYDYAPGALLIAEAGGIVRNLYSNKYDYRNVNFIAAAPAIYKELTKGPSAIFPVK
jgi:myo-inositol-1(or 4)-monophosphatase